MTKTERESLKESYEERAAILEFDAGLSRSEAEKKAFTMVYGDQNDKDRTVLYV